MKPIRVLSVKKLTKLRFLPLFFAILCMGFLSGSCGLSVGGWQGKPRLPLCASNNWQLSPLSWPSRDTCSLRVKTPPRSESGAKNSTASAPPSGDMRKRDQFYIILAAAEVCHYIGGKNHYSESISPDLNNPFCLIVKAKIFPQITWMQSLWKI